MQQRRARVLGPYREPDGYRLISLDGEGRRSSCKVTTAQEAERLKAILERKLEAPRKVLTVSEAIKKYETYLTQVKENKPRSIARTLWSLKRMFPDPRDLTKLTPKYCAKRYQVLMEELANDSHRNILAEARTFLNWCIAKPRKWLKSNPLAEVKGEGKRKHGKAQLRIDEARKWQAHALALAEAGESGAVAALLTLCGVCATEAVTLRVRDVDDGGRLLWVAEQEAKTEERQRQIEIPDWLRPHLLALCEGATPLAWLFRTTKGETGHPWRDWPREWVQRICERAGVPRVTAHGMRGLAATLAVIGGANTAIEAAQQQLGHSDKSTTEQSYIAPGAAEQARQRAAFRVLKGDG